MPGGGQGPGGEDGNSSGGLGGLGDQGDPGGNNPGPGGIPGTNPVGPVNGLGTSLHGGGAFNGTHAGNFGNANANFGGGSTLSGTQLGALISSLSTFGLPTAAIGQLVGQMVGNQSVNGTNSPASVGHGDGMNLEINPATGIPTLPFVPGQFTNLEQAGVYGANQAYGLLNTGPSQIYPGSSVAGFGDTSQQSQEQIQSLATGNPYLAGATNRVNDITSAQNPFLQGFAGFSDRQNQYLDQTFDRGAAQIRDQVNSQFGRGGRSNSGFHSKTVGDSIGGFGADLYGSAFDAQMNRDLAALNSGSAAYQGQNAQALQAAELLPALNNAKFDDAKQLQNLGQAQDLMSQLQLDDEINRFNQNQNNPWTNLQNYMNIVNGVSSTQQPPNYTPATPDSNSTAETLGALAAIYSIYAGSSS